MIIYSSRSLHFRGVSCYLGRQQLKSTLPSLVVVVAGISANEGTTSSLREPALPREARKLGGTTEFLKDPLQRAATCSLYQESKLRD